MSVKKRPSQIIAAASLLLQPGLFKAIREVAKAWTCSLSRPGSWRWDPAVHQLRLSGFIHELGNKPGPVSFIAGFPHHRNLVYSDVAHLALIVLQLQHAAFDLDDVAPQARRPTTKHVSL